MMSETATQTAVCNACGAEVRNASLFCYGCGESVKPEETVEEQTPAEREIVAQPGSRPPLRSAASLRKQRRAFNRQPIEVTWEPRTGSPIAFVIATIVLVIAVLGFLILALYLR